jgi:release factor glutamine methyltransferase
MLQMELIADDMVSAALAQGRCAFLGLELLAARGVAVPRPETELLARTALRVLHEEGGGLARVADVCCGAGNLACALGAYLPGAEIFAVDLLPAACALAEANAARLGLTGRVTVLGGDLCAPLAHLGLQGSLDVVVSAPPCVPSARLRPGGEREALLRHEPREAVDGGPQGTALHQRLCGEAQPLLRPEGVLLLEVAPGQAQKVSRMLLRAGYQGITEVPDAAGIPRVVLGRAP